MTSEDIVSVIFVQGTTPGEGKETRPAEFRYIRSNLVSHGPGSLFAAHFGPKQGLNNGKSEEELPTKLSLDRSIDLFSRFVDPLLRGYSGMSSAEFFALSEGTRAALQADADFYGLDDLVPTLSPPQPEFELPSVHIMDFATATAKLRAGQVPFKVVRATAGIKRVQFERQVLIKTDNTYNLIFKLHFHASQDDIDDEDEDVHCAGGSPADLRFVYAYADRQCSLRHDPAEVAFWAAFKEFVKAKTPNGIGATEIEFRHSVFHLGRKLDEMIAHSIKNGLEMPEFGIYESTFSERISTGNDVLPCGIKKPYVMVSITLTGTKAMVHVRYLDLETVKNPAAVLDLWSPLDDEDMFKD